jgi:hypothetical protein
MMTGLKESASPASMLGWGELCDRLEQEAANAGVAQRRNLIPVGVALAAACSFALVVSFGHRIGVSSFGVNISKSSSVREETTSNAQVATTARTGGRTLTTGSALTKQAASSPSHNDDRSMSHPNASESAPPVMVVSNSHVRSHMRGYTRPDAGPVMQSTQAVSSRRDPLGVGAEEPAPDRNLVLTGVPSGQDSQRATNYVMGSIPAPQTISAQDGQGRSETL